MCVRQQLFQLNKIWKTVKKLMNMMDCHQILLPTSIGPDQIKQCPFPWSPQKNIGLLKTSEEMKTNKLPQVCPQSKLWQKSLEITSWMSTSFHIKDLQSLLNWICHNSLQNFKYVTRCLNTKKVIDVKKNWTFCNPFMRETLKIS